MANIILKSSDDISFSISKLVHLMLMFRNEALCLETTAPNTIFRIDRAQAKWSVLIKQLLEDEEDVEVIPIPEISTIY